MSNKQLGRLKLRNKGGLTLIYTVRETPKNYIFGCGNVRFPKEVVKGYIRELKRIQESKDKKDFDKVSKVLSRKGYDIKGLEKGAIDLFTQSSKK